MPDRVTCNFPGCSRSSTPGGERCGVHATAYRPKSPIPPVWDRQIKLYTAFRALDELSPGTIALRTSHLARFAREVDVDPYDVTLDDLVLFFSSHNSWTSETYRVFAASIKGFYRWAVQTKKITESPAEHLPMRKLAEHTAKPVPADGYAAALAKADMKVRWMIRLAGELGMRRAEVADLHRDDITETPEGWLLKVVGKGAKTRVIPMPRQFATDLIAYIDAHGVDGWAFPSPTGGALTPHWVGTLVRQVLPEGYTMHKLRHMALTNVYRRSGDLLLTAQLAGHSSVATTQKHYVAPDYSKLRAVVEGIAS